MTKEEKAQKNREWRRKNPGYTRKMYLRHRDRILASNKAYHELHHEKLLVYWRTRNARPEIVARRKPTVKMSELPPEKAEHVRALRRAYCVKHSVKLRAYWKKYRSDNREKTKAHNKSNWHRRRALIKNASINLEGIKSFFQSVKSKRSAICYYCEKSISTKLIHFDHIVPLSKGGLHAVENLCVSCSQCNLNKQDKPVEAWVRIGQQVLNL